MKKDLHALKIGDALPELTTDPITPLSLALFAGGSGDHNPIHVDAEFAKEGGFPDVFAHGMLSMAYLGRLLSDWAGPERLRGFSVRFTSITPLRSRVRCSGKVTELFEREGERCARLELMTQLPDGTVTLAGEAVVAIG